MQRRDEERKRELERARARTLNEKLSVVDARMDKAEDAHQHQLTEDQHEQRELAALREAALKESREETQQRYGFHAWNSAFDEFTEEPPYPLR